jgi:mannose-6-phosphate isomerase-like protein (cupin superfamily)
MTNVSPNAVVPTNDVFSDEHIVRFNPSCNLQTVRDGRGGIFTWMPPEPILEWNMLIFHPNKIRGNHYHLEFVEYFMVVEGYGVMVSRDKEGKEVFFHLSKGQCLRVPIGIPHAFYAIEYTTAMAFLTKRWDDCNPPIIFEHIIDSSNDPTAFPITPPNNETK